MFHDLPFDPERAASSLIALAEALRSDPSSFDARSSLGSELLSASNAARAWAAERGLPVACFPAAPAPHELTLGRAIAFLVDLAEVLLFAGARALVFESMASVVKLLHLQKAPALLELEELEEAVLETLQNLEMIADDARRLDSHLARLSERSIALVTARDVSDRADRIRTHLDYVIASVREIQRGIESWNLSSVSRGNGEPRL